MTTAVDIHPAYDLVVRDTVDSALEEAKRLATAGAEEGTLVWAREQTAGHGRFGRTWESAPGNLYCSLILRPEDAPATAAQLVYVAAVSLGEAIASLVSPRVELRYRWPNDILLWDAKVGGILLEPCQTRADMLDWLILSLAVNVKRHPIEAEFVATSMQAEGCPNASEIDLLQAFTRCFLSWANRWGEEGLAPVRKAWFQRADGIGQPIEVELEQETVKGTFEKLDDDGALVMALPKEGHRRITVADFFSFHSQRRAV
ncbi:MAG: biotin--[acetyl-CoA-carboxylase] ligase [Gammaproteobacteria bacterium]|nr:MAG: biotin--[acetyl-CoA-carboxylase] ligase [Gammaproteobacteria bacterium]